MNGHFPRTDAADRWLEKILAERFGHAWHISQIQGGLSLQLAGDEGAIVFDAMCDGFTEARSDLPFTKWDAEREGWDSALGGPLPAPGVARLPTPLIENDAGACIVHYDILGLVYWMLARVEEVGRKDLDSHGRFPATSSHAYKHGYLERPVVDEWLMILGQVIQGVWPGIRLKQHEFNIKVSHDVDSPSLYAFKSWPTIGRMMAGDILKRYNLKAFVTAPYVKLATGNQLHPADPFNTFDWLMDVSEANNLQSAFYFICGRTEPVYDADYEPEHPVIRELMRRVHRGGHEIGLHPSYNTYKRPELIRQEAERLKRICAEENIAQSHWGGRMHYLRWEHPTTLRAWDAAGMAYDTTLGYADHPGFRCGTCHEYSAFDPVAQEQLKLIIRPLVVMESTIISSAYLDLGVTQKASLKMRLLKEVCAKAKGNFSLLWHNSELDTPELKQNYLQTLRN